MSTKTIRTCDNCGKESEALYKVTVTIDANLRFWNEVSNSRSLELCHKCVGLDEDLVVSRSLDYPWLKFFERHALQILKKMGLIKNNKK